MSVNGAVDFRYLNYCHATQDPLSTYGEASLKKIREAATKYDPAGVFQTRVPGGFKIPAALPGSPDVATTTTTTAKTDETGSKKRRSWLSTKVNNLSLSMKNGVLFK